MQIEIRGGKYRVSCEVRRRGEASGAYVDAAEQGIQFHMRELDCEEWKTVYEVTVENVCEQEFEGVILFKMLGSCQNPKFFMPGYMYNRNTADMPSSGRKAFPRMKLNGNSMPESNFFMTRSDRLAEPVSLVYDQGRVYGIAAAPMAVRECETGTRQFCGFTCHMEDQGMGGAGYTLGYENAPWLFVQTATVLEREPLTGEHSFYISGGESFSFEMTLYDYEGKDERAVHQAIRDVYRKYHEEPRKISGMDIEKAQRMLSSAVRDDAWLEQEQHYAGFVYDRPGGYEYNRIPSISWTNGLAVAVPMLMTANLLQDEKARQQSLVMIQKIIEQQYNSASGFLYESVEDGVPTPRGWWYDGMHSGGHSAYLNGQAVYYLLKAFMSEKEAGMAVHEDWLLFAKKLVTRMNEVKNTDAEYPFAMSEKTGAGLEYDSMGGVWFLAATALYIYLTGDSELLPGARESEKHYYRTFVQKVECYGGPLDTDKAVDSEGVLGYIRAVRYLHEWTGEELFLEHMRDALYYEYTFKLGYNTQVRVPPLSEVHWSSCGGSITSTANPHIHPMSSTIIPEMKYYLSCREDDYVRSRMEDTIGWSLQTFNTVNGEYGYGKPGWMSERFCFCQGLLTEKYPDGSPASTWFALMPWASASLLEGFAGSRIVDKDE